MNHEQYIQAVRDIVASTQSQEVKDKLLACKLCYGAGDGSYRGVCHYSAWKNGHPDSESLVEIAATGEEHPVQLAGTTIHELAHTLTRGAGHGKAWKNCADKLGLRLARAVGHCYQLSHFAPVIRPRIAELAAKLSDGKPTFGHGSGNGSGAGLTLTLRPCTVGIGTRGGKSRGKGSGSRQRLYVCDCTIETLPAGIKPPKVRIASDEFLATCDRCGSKFRKAEKGEK